MLYQSPCPALRLHRSRNPTAGSSRGNPVRPQIWLMAMPFWARVSIEVKFRNRTFNSPSLFAHRLRLLGHRYVSRNAYWFRARNSDPMLSQSWLSTRNHAESDARENIHQTFLNAIWPSTSGVVHLVRPLRPK
jgi:hypothetical protein